MAAWSVQWLWTTSSSRLGEIASGSCSPQGGLKMWSDDAVHRPLVAVFASEHLSRLHRLISKQALSLAVDPRLPCVSEEGQNSPDRCGSDYRTHSDDNRFPAHDFRISSLRSRV